MPFTVIPGWISNYIHYNVWDEITYLFPNFSSATIEIWEWIRNFILHFTGHVISRPCWGYNWSMSVNWAPVGRQELIYITQSVQWLLAVQGPLTSSVQIMACRLYGAKPLSEPMLEIHLVWTKYSLVHYNTISFLQDPHKCHPIARRLGLDMTTLTPLLDLLQS